MGALDTFKVNKNVFYYPQAQLSSNTFNLSIHADSTALGAKIYANNLFVKQLNTLNENLDLPMGSNALAFSKQGYLDSVFQVHDSLPVLHFSLVPRTYFVESDSIIIHFQGDSSVQYTRGISLQSLNNTNQSVSLNRCPKNYSNLGFQALSEAFCFRNLNSGNKLKLRAAIALNQPDSISPDSTYLMCISNNNSYQKIFPDTWGDSIHYHSQTQKLDLDSIKLQGFKEIVFMKRLKPITHEGLIYDLSSGDTLFIALDSLFNDPDHLADDITVTILNNNNPNYFDLDRTGDSLRVITSSCSLDSALISLEAIHDGLVANNTFVLRSSPPILLDIAYADASCGSTNGWASVNPAGGTPPYTYSWSNGQSTDTIFNLSVGIYNVIVSDAEACSTSTQINIQELPLSASLIDTVAYFYPYDTIRLSADAPAGSICDWAVDDGKNVQLYKGTSIAFVAGSVASYTVKLICISAGTGCTSNSEFLIHNLEQIYSGGIGDGNSQVMKLGLAHSVNWYAGGTGDGNSKDAYWSSKEGNVWCLGGIGDGYIHTIRLGQASSSTWLTGGIGDGHSHVLELGTAATIAWLAGGAGDGPQGLPDRPIAEPDRKGLWPKQRHPGQLPCPRRLRDK